MLRRLPLFPRILAWFFLNLLILGAALFILFQMQFRLGTDSLLSGAMGGRIRAASELIAAELKSRPETNWNAVLTQFGKAYKSQLALFRPDGALVSGESETIPETVREKLVERRGIGEGMGRGPPPGRGPRRAMDAASPLAEAEPRFLVHTREPPRYWIGVRLPLSEPDSPRPWPLTLLFSADSLLSGGLYLDPKPWVLIGSSALFLSVLFWMPFVRVLTRSIGRMTAITRRIADGDFAARVNSRRGDELGQLGEAIDQMAARLAGLVTGQKRFLGDIAHELCSPLARIQLALGILEQRAGTDHAEQLADLRSEIQEMSALVNELLSFSKASLGGKPEPLEPVAIDPLLSSVLSREAPGNENVRVDVSAPLAVLGRPDLLSRAISNLLRNAIRHAGQDGPILLKAARMDDQIAITVQDHGPGVTPAELQRIFDPFYRGDASRSRETGGTGLGLAIVKTCVEACQGTVTARNRSPKGFEVTLLLKPAE